MLRKIIADSSVDADAIAHLPCQVVPLRVVAGDQEYVDGAGVDTTPMLDYLEHYKGRSSSACPGVGDWLAAFGDAEEIFCVTITGTLSGSYNSACVAREEYLAQHPNRKVHVFDSLTTGPEMGLMVEKLVQLEALPFEEVVAQMQSYSTELLFCLTSLKNLANNGRVSPAVAKIAGILGIRVVGRASERGDLEQLEKARGERRALDSLVKLMKKLGYVGGKLRINHCQNLPAAQTLREMVLALWPKADIRIGTTGILCSFYAERHGLLLGFES